MQDMLKLIGRGLVGWHAEGIGRYGRFSSTGGSLEDYLKQASDGTLIYDASEADSDAFIDFVFKGPMSDCTLNPGEYHKFQDMEALKRMVVNLKGGFQFLGAMALAGFSSMDTVATDIYLALLREKVPGVKIGTVKNHQVEWEPPKQLELPIE